MAKQLTAVAVKNLRHGNARREIPDGGCAGLFLVVQASGHKSFAMRFRRPSGRTAKLTLGPVDLSGRELSGEPVIGQPLTLAAARRLVVDLQRQRAMGRDVAADQAAARRQQRAEHARRAASTFAAAAEDFVADRLRRNRDWTEKARLLGFEPTAEGLKVIKDGLADRWRTCPSPTSTATRSTAWSTRRGAEAPPDWSGAAAGRRGPAR